MDPLSDVLSLLRPGTYAAGGFDLGGAWSVRFGAYVGLKCYAVASGACWLAVEGEQPVPLHAGDCFLLPRGLPFRLASDLALPAVEVHTVFPLPLQGRIFCWDGPPDCRERCLSLGARFAVSGTYAQALLAELPPVIHIRSAEGRSELHASIERLRQELLRPQPGSALVARQLATMMLVQALRLYLAACPPGRSGWLAALTDPQLAPAMEAIHEQPARAWTLALLAQRCGMSRSVFAERFKAAMGLPPMDYLVRWRMMLAEDQLNHTREPVSALANALGYRSESAFSKAFRRVMGASPRELRRRGNATVSPEAT